MRTDTRLRQDHTPAVHVSPPATSLSLMTPAPALNRGNAVPLYVQLIDQIRRLIDSGAWPAASRIPSERELCDMCNVSRITVRQALQVLVREGLLIRAGGRGTYLAAQAAAVNANTNGSAAAASAAASQHLLQHGTHPGGWRFKPSRWPAPAHVLSALGVDDGGRLTCLSRWRQPDVWETVYLANARCPGFRGYHQDDVPLYETLSRYYGIVPDRAMLHLYLPSSSGAVPASESAGGREPILHIQQTTFARDGRAFEHVEVHRARMGRRSIL